jgi:hypothetical protein
VQPRTVAGSSLLLCPMPTGALGLLLSGLLSSVAQFRSLLAPCSQARTHHSPSYIKLLLATWQCHCEFNTSPNIEQTSDLRALGDDDVSLQIHQSYQIEHTSAGAGH